MDNMPIVIIVFKELACYFGDVISGRSNCIPSRITTSKQVNK